MTVPSDRPECEAPEGHCITCADEGVVMTVLESDGNSALCAAGDGAATSVAVDLVAPVARGEELLVHAGVALVRVGAPS